VCADTGTESVIPLPNVTGKILGKVIEYCKYHVEVRVQAASHHLQNENADFRTEVAVRGMSLASTSSHAGTSVKAHAHDVSQIAQVCHR